MALGQLGIFLCALAWGILGGLLLALTLWVQATGGGLDINSMLLMTVWAVGSTLGAIGVAGRCPCCQASSDAYQRLQNHHVPQVSAGHTRHTPLPKAPPPILPPVTDLTLENAPLQTPRDALTVVSPLP